MGLSNSQVVCLETGRVRITQLHLIAFEQVYRINPKWLAEGAGQMVMDNHASLKSVSDKLFVIIGTAVEKVIASENLNLNVFQKTKIYCSLYEQFRGKKDIDQSEIFEYARFVTGFIVSEASFPGSGLQA